MQEQFPATAVDKQPRLHPWLLLSVGNNTFLHHQGLVKEGVCGWFVCFALFFIFSFFYDSLDWK